MSILTWKNFKGAIVKGMIVSLAGICVMGLVACGSKAKKQDDTSKQTVQQQEDSRKTEVPEKNNTVTEKEDIAEAGTEDDATQETVIGKTENASEKAKQNAAGAAQKKSKDNSQ